jgi:hypothetical protein
MEDFYSQTFRAYPNIKCLRLLSRVPLQTNFDQSLIPYELTKRLMPGSETLIITPRIPRIFRRLREETNLRRDAEARMFTY